jgi:hypothetical protein
VACGTGSTASKGSVSVMATWTGAEQASFMAVVKPFTDSIIHGTRPPRPDAL